MDTNKLKTFALLFICLSFRVVSFGQDWNPFPPNLTLIYKYGDVQNGRTGLMAAKSDSVVTDGLNTVHYFYRVDRSSYPNETATGCQGQMPYLAHSLDQDHCFGKKMILEPNGDCHFISSTTDSFLLKSNAAQGLSWAWDDTTTATVNSISTTTVFGQADSVKVIMLSNGHTLRLSQNHGLLSGFAFLPSEYLGSSQPDFALWGIQELPLGGKLPGFDGIYRREVGDRIGYFSRNHSSPFGGHTVTYDGFFQVDSILPGNDASYQIRTQWTFDQQSAQGGNVHTVHPLHDTIVTTYRADFPYLELLPFQHQTDWTYGNWTRLQTGAFLWQNDTSRVALSFDYGYERDTCAQATFWIGYDGSSEYFEGIGLWENSNLGTDYSITYTTTCFQTASGDYGTCPLLSGITDTIPMHNFSAFPNPVPETLHLKFHGSLSNDSHLVHIYSALGSLVQTRYVPKGTHEFELDVTGLLEGMYIVKIEQKSAEPIIKRMVVGR